MFLIFLPITIDSHSPGYSPSPLPICKRTSSRLKLVVRARHTGQLLVHLLECLSAFLIDDATSLMTEIEPLICGALWDVCGGSVTPETV
jgi:hypothetical protein